MAKTGKKTKEAEKKQCQGKSKEGKPCPYQAKPDSRFCGIHGSEKRSGRKSKLQSIDYQQVVKLCKLGATDKDIADFFEVSTVTINAWKKKDEQFLNSLKDGREYADANVSERLYQRALGFEHSEEKIFQYEGRIVRAQTRKHYPPDSTAAIFWLKNRRPDAWRDRQEVDMRMKTEDWDPEKGDPKEFVKRQLTKGEK